MDIGDILYIIFIEKTIEINYHDNMVMFGKSAGQIFHANKKQYMKVII
jgi:hypothetical protein